MSAATSSQYESGFHAWAISTDALIRSGQMHCIDQNALAEEVESSDARRNPFLTFFLRRLIYSFLLQTVSDRSGPGANHFWLPSENCAYHQSQIQAFVRD